MLIFGHFPSELFKISPEETKIVTPGDLEKAILKINVRDVVEDLFQERISLGLLKKVEGTEDYEGPCPYCYYDGNVRREYGPKIHISSTQNRYWCDDIVDRVEGGPLMLAEEMEEGAFRSPGEGRIYSGITLVTTSHYLLAKFGFVEKIKKYEWDPYWDVRVTCSDPFPDIIDELIMKEYDTFRRDPQRSYDENGDMSGCLTDEPYFWRANTEETIVQQLLSDYGINPKEIDVEWFKREIFSDD